MNSINIPFHIILELSKLNICESYKDFTFVQMIDSDIILQFQNKYYLATILFNNMLIYSTYDTVKLYQVDIIK